MNTDDNDRNTPRFAALKSREECSTKQLNDNSIKKKLFKRIFLHNKSASISIDLRNCLPSITTKTMMIIIMHTTFLDRDEYTSITKQVSYPVNVVYRRIGEIHSDVGMQSEKKNQFTSLSVINLFVHRWKLIRKSVKKKNVFHLVSHMSMWSSTFEWNSWIIYRNSYTRWMREKRWFHRWIWLFDMVEIHLIDQVQHTHRIIDHDENRMTTFNGQTVIQCIGLSTLSYAIWIWQYILQMFDW